MDTNNTTPAPEAAPTPVSEAPAQTPAEAAPAETTTPAPTGQQIVDVVAPPERTSEEVAEAAATPTEDAPVQTVSSKPKAPASADVKLAIVATVIIVLTLAALATMAYLKQK